MMLQLLHPAAESADFGHLAAVPTARYKVSK